MKHTKSLQFHPRPNAALVRAVSPTRRWGPPAAEQTAPLSSTSLFVMEDELPPAVVVDHPDITRPGGGATVRAAAAASVAPVGGRRGSGNSDSNNVRVTFVRHPDIPDIREDEELASLPPRRPLRKVSMQHNSPASFLNGSRAAAAGRDDLYLVAPEPLEPEYSSLSSYGAEASGAFRAKRDRSLSLPAVHGNFRLLRSAESEYR